MTPSWARAFFIYLHFQLRALCFRIPPPPGDGCVYGRRQCKVTFPLCSPLHTWYVFIYLLSLYSVVVLNGGTKCQPVCQNNHWVECHKDGGGESWGPGRHCKCNPGPLGNGMGVGGAHRKASQSAITSLYNSILWSVTLSSTGGGKTSFCSGSLT